MVTNLHIDYKELGIGCFFIGMKFDGSIWYTHKDCPWKQFN